jgi:DNA-binding CsgD family transcriptional regulator
LVFITDPEANLSQPTVLQHLYGFTPAEAQIATQLASGMGVKEIAENLKVRQNTVRIHLKNIYDKTGARRQAELVRLVLSGPAALRGQS